MRWCLPFALCAAAFAQTPPPAVDRQSTLPQGVPPRAAPSDYPAHTQIGPITIAADFTGHNIPTREGPLTTEDYVAIEVAFYGPPDAKLVLSAEDFTLRVNGKKPLIEQSFEDTLRSLRDPDWIPPDSSSSGDSKKTSVSGSGGGSKDLTAPPPPPPPMPPELRRAMAVRVRRDSMMVGERALPQAGLIYFSYSGRTENLKSLQLIYNGPAGKATIPLEP
jgi:hypothetical protein